MDPDGGRVKVAANMHRNIFALAGRVVSAQTHRVWLVAPYEPANFEGAESNRPLLNRAFLLHFYLLPAGWASTQDGSCYTRYSIARHECGDFLCHESDTRTRDRQLLIFP
jgi:hypothetical protein